MIACISPSNLYDEETLSTLSYASRTMNIKNTPIIQMDPKEQIILKLKKDLHLLRDENLNLRIISNHSNRVVESSLSNPPFSSNSFSDGDEQLPHLSRKIPIKESDFSSSNNRKNHDSNQFENILLNLKKRNNQLNDENTRKKKELNSTISENMSLMLRLENLSRSFISSNEYGTKNNEQSKPESNKSINENTSTLIDNGNNLNNA